MTRETSLGTVREPSANLIASLVDSGWWSWAVDASTVTCSAGLASLLGFECSAPLQVAGYVGKQLLEKQIERLSPGRGDAEAVLALLGHRWGPPVGCGDQDNHCRGPQPLASQDHVFHEPAHPSSENPASKLSRQL